MSIQNLPNAPLITTIVKRYIGSADYDELLGAACLGYSKAIQRFDPVRGNKLSTFAVPYIRGEILHYLRDQGKRPRVLRKWHAIYSRCWRLSDKAACEKEAIPLDLWREIKTACSASMISVDFVSGVADGYTHDNLVSPGSDVQEELPLLASVVNRIASSLKHLTQREQAEIRRVLFEGGPLRDSNSIIRAGLAKLI